MSHIGAAGSLFIVSKVTLREWNNQDSGAYPAIQQAMVWSCQPCVSWMPRDRQRMIGATIQAQMSCQTIDGHL